MWIKITDLVGNQMFINLECVTNIESGKDSYGNPYAYPHFTK